MAVPSIGSFLDHVDRTVSVHHMLNLGDAVLVGVSGGPDSVALFHALIELTPKYAVRLGVAHLNHCLRGRESDRDAQFVAKLVQNHGVPFYPGTEDVRKLAVSRKLSIEEAGRQARYDFFITVADREGYDKIALGHHSDDNAELILMYLIRGSGLQGLSGIPPVRGNRWIRPLIEQSRSEILEFLHAHKIDYVTDSSNSDQRYLRNRVRHHLIPLLQRDYNPQIIHNINRLSDIIRSDNKWLVQQVQPLIEQSIVHTEKSRITVSMSRFTALDKTVQRRLLRHVIGQVKGDLRRITYAHIEAVRHLVQKGPEHGRLDLPDRIRVTRCPERLVLSKEKKPLREMRSHTGGVFQKQFEYRIQPPASVFIRELGIFFSASTLPINELPDMGASGQEVAFFDMDTLKFPLILRNYKPGDRFAPLGIGGTQKIKDFFINNKVPRKERVKSSVLLSGDRIVWVVGHRIDESAKITPETERVLKAELSLA